MERNASMRSLTDEDYETYDKGWQIGTLRRGSPSPQQETSVSSDDTPISVAYEQ